MPARIRRDLFFGDIISLTPEELKVISAGINLPDINQQLKDTSEKLNQHITDSTLEFDSIETNVATNYYTKTTVDDIVATVKKNSFMIVSALPTTGEEGIIYLIKKKDENIHTQYIWENESWIDLGDTTLNLDNYYTKAMVDDKITSTQALITSETTQRKTEDSSLKTLIETEVSERKAADETLTTNLAAEVTARTNGDTSTLNSATKKVEDETARAKAAESTLETNLNAEIVNRQNFDSSTLKSAKEYADEKAKTINETITALDTRIASLEDSINGEY